MSEVVKRIRKERTADELDIVIRRPAVSGLLVPGTKCPLCGSPLVIIPLTLFNVNMAEEYGVELDMREDEVGMWYEEICENPDCKHDVFRKVLFDLSKAI